MKPTKSQVTPAIALPSDRYIKPKESTSEEVSRAATCIRFCMDHEARLTYLVRYSRQLSGDYRR